LVGRFFQKAYNNKHELPEVSVHLAQWLQRRRFKKIGQPETRIACCGHVCKWIGTKLAIFIEDLPGPNELKLQAIHVYYCMLSGKKKLFFCGKGDNSNLNININKIQLAMN
jgi:hypothetical protein